MNSETYDQQCYECDKQNYKANELGDGFLVGCDNCVKYGCPETCFKWSKGHGGFLCDTCWEENAKCIACNDTFPEDEMNEAENMCWACWWNCENCKERREDATGIGLCDKCAVCAGCGDNDYKDEMNKHKDVYYCDDCNPSANCGCELCEIMKENQ